MSMILITPQKEIISIIAELIVDKDFSSDYYFSLYSKTRDNKILSYTLVVEDVYAITSSLSDIVSKLSKIKVIRFGEFKPSREHDLLITNKE